MRFVYFLWGIIPALLVLLALRAAWRRAMKLHGKEHPLRYLRRALETGVVLAIAIVTDQWFVDDLITFIGRGHLHNDIVRFLWYPLLLTTMAYLSLPFDTKERPVFSEELRLRMRLPPR